MFFAAVTDTLTTPERGMTSESRDVVISSRRRSTNAGIVGHR